MSTTLYRKYRPQTFAEVVGQNHIKVTLKNEIESGKIAHAYLFSGPRGVGKTTIARILAKALNCQQRQGAEPCDKCSTCEEIKAGRSLDLIEIDAASNRGINEIRELREQTRVTPAKEKYKIFIIDEVHMLTAEAFNALLKTLEEPPAHVVFILATTEIHKIPETIISRCQRFDFKKVPIPETILHLTAMVKKENIKVESEVLENIARHSEGYLRDAISLLGQVLSLGEKNITVEEATLVLPRSDAKIAYNFIGYLLKNKTAEALASINTYLEEGGDLEYFTREIIDFLRRILLALVTGNWQELLWDMENDTLKELQQQLAGIGPDKIGLMIEVLLEALAEIRRAEIIQLPLELAIIKITVSAKEPADKKFDDFSGPPAAPGSSKKSFPPADNKRPEPITAAIPLKTIMQKWPEVIETLKEYNHSLSSFLKVGRPREIQGRDLVVCFKYAFHLERVKESKNKIVVETVLEKIYLEKLSINCQIDENLAWTDDANSSGQNGDGMVEMVLDKLGGEVIS